MKHYEMQFRHSIFVFSFGQPHSKPPLNTSFNHPVKKLKNKYEKTVVRPASRISNGDDPKLVCSNEERL